KLRQDAGFVAHIEGPTYAQPLYVENAAGGKKLLIVATEQNLVYGLNADTGAQLWRASLGAPVPLEKLPCGNISPLGITGTPVIDLGSRTVFLDAMTTPDGGRTKQHKIYGLSIDDGRARPGWPFDVGAKVEAGGVKFDSAVQNQRPGLALLDGVLYVAYGGHYGDCGDYRGWVLGLPLRDPYRYNAWVAGARGGAVWAPGALVVADNALFATTGNTVGAVTWSGGEAILKFNAGSSFNATPTDYFAPADWKTLDAQDLDLGGSNAVPVNLSHGDPARLMVAFGKNGKAYLTNRTGLGGISDGVASLAVAADPIITAPASYSTDDAVYIFFKGQGIGCPKNQAGDLVALKVVSGTPPAMKVEWCARQNGMGSPIVTTSDASGSNPIVWSVGAEGDNRLRGFEALSGRLVFESGEKAGAMTNVRRYQTPIIAGGHLFVAADDRVFRFSPP
ncbi:MAG: hypothetical protein HY074_18775, partial [Deltaproteobacteria bacterium]|nr:hypothetical protein [Deltaproteobacteria bacterium]